MIVHYAVRHTTVQRGKPVTTGPPALVAGSHGPPLATCHIPTIPKPTPRHMLLSRYIFYVTSIHSTLGLGSASGRAAHGTASSGDSAMSLGLLAADRR